MKLKLKTDDNNKIIVVDARRNEIIQDVQNVEIIYDIEGGIFFATVTVLNPILDVDLNDIEIGSILLQSSQKDK